jgi:diacylglycerol kinase family enzyme
MHKKSKLKTLMVFPSIFKGEHVKHTEMVEVLTGHRIHVEFDQPTALQIDGETVLGVTEYTAEAAVVKEL